MNVCHDLITPYTFTTVAGSFDTRFELRYKQIENDEDDDYDRKGSLDGRTYNIKIYDLSGRLVKDVNSDNLDLVISELPKGLFILKTTIDGKTKTKKIIL